MRVVLTVFYGLAATTAGLFHDHHDAGDARHLAAAAAHPHSQGCDQVVGKLPERQSVPPQSPLEGPQCLVCKFLAQKPLAASAVEEVVAISLVETVTFSAPPQCSAPISPSWHSRAPPDAV
jgi:hypothetical protein